MVTIYSECIEPPLIIADAAGRTIIADYEKITLFIPKGTSYNYFSSIAWKEFGGIREYTVTHKITYMIDDKIYFIDTLEVGEEVTTKNPPQKEGYSFAGWENIPNIMPGKDLYFYGKYVINKYELIYKVNGNIYKTDSIEYNASITPEPPIIQEGYTFSGWSEIPETMPDNDVVVTSSFIKNTYKLTYLVDGMVYMSSYVTYGEAIFPMTPPTKEGYIFSGWSEIPETMPAHDVIITGSFEVNSINEITTDTRVDVYDLQGIKVQEQVLSKELEKILPQGVYIVNGRKLVVK